MEDSILNEVNKISKVIEAILIKIGLIKKTKDSTKLIQTEMIELQNQLGLDFNAVVIDEKMVDILIGEYGFTEGDLDRFAILLFEFFEASNNDLEKQKIKMRVSEIYKYLKDNGNLFSMERFYISNELEM